MNGRMGDPLPAAGKWKHMATLVERTTAFVQSAWAESKKVTWPTRQELTDSTRVVIVATLIIMLYLFVVDRILTFLLNFLL